MITFESREVGNSYLHIRYISREYESSNLIWRSSGQGQGHRSKKVENSYSRIVKLRVVITPVLWNQAMTFACSMGFSAMMNWTVWPPSLSHDRKWPCITKSTHSRVVGLRLEENLVVYKFNRPTDAYSLIAWPRATNVKKCGTQKLITRSSAAAKSTARPLCWCTLWHFSGENMLMVNQPLLRNWPRKLYWIRQNNTK